MTDRKELILDVARARFDRFGVKKTTMDEIARDAGVSKKTLYEQFRNKEDLFVSVFIKEALNNRRWIMERVAHLEDPLEKIRQVLRITVGYHWQETFMAKVLQDEDGLYAPFLKDKYRLQVEEDILGIFADMLEAGIRSRQIRDLDPYIVAYFIFKLFQSVTY
ncbi:MAG: TetR/AcrR family transcriptional regulator, partial [Proteobacteria bacterium]|nr:TetR/AcrR family transcriptional regulator [Pseudomonadota bacterium]